MPQVKRLLSLIAKVPLWRIYAVCTALLVASTVVWWLQVYQNPRTVFWGMLEQSLSTQSATIETKQTSEQSTARQLIQFELGSVNRAHSLTTVNQGSTVIKTEIIGTRTADYSRYRSVKTDQKNAAGKKLDVSKIEGVWTKNAAAQGNAQSGNQQQQLLAQAVLGIGLPVGSVPVPIGAVPPADRAKLLEMIKSQGVYETTFSKVSKKRVDGRMQYTYPVKIQTILYVQAMKRFAKSVGLHQLDEVDANSFQSSEPIEVSLIVDAASRQLVGVSRDDERIASYQAYGVPVKATVPTMTITAQELQKRLNEL